MCEENDKFITESLIPFLKRYREERYDSKHLLKQIAEKESQFVSTLDDKQKTQFEELWDLLFDY